MIGRCDLSITSFVISDKAFATYCRTPFSLNPIFHPQVTKVCCQTFIPTKDMLSRFNSSMYDLYYANAGIASSSALSTEVNEDIEQDDYIALTNFDSNAEEYVLFSLPDIPTES